MSKTLRTAAIVVGAVALVATGVGALGAAGAFGATFSTATVAGAGALGTTGLAISATAAGTFAATAAAVGGVLTTVASGLALGATLTAKKPTPSIGGSQTRFKADPLAGVPYAIGRTLVAGNIVYHEAHGADNRFNTFVAVLSGGGPIDSIESFLVEKQPVSFSAGAATGGYATWMWKAGQLGATPESAALAIPAGTGSSAPGWDSDNKLSGMAAEMWTLRFDKKGKVFAAGTPQPGWVGKWVKVYDPRLDDTYPGGEGDCRALDEATYVWSENPYLHALTWLLGRWQNGARVLGVGAAPSMIDVPAFVEGANVADANEWAVGGQVYSTDSKWNVLKLMLQAGGGEPLRLGAKISCLVNTPRVSLATVTRHDIMGEASVAAVQPRRDRFNAVVPVYRSEAHDWELVSAAPVMVGDYVTEDGERRTREIVYPLVQDVDQVAELALYDIVNAREFGPIELQLKPKWLGYKPGDCITVDEEELGLEGQDILLLNRTLEPTGLVTFTARSETAAKHAFALGETGTPPPTPSVTGDDLSTVLAPEPDAWELVGTEFSDNGTTIPALVVTGACENINADAVLFELQVDGASEWTKLGMEPPTVTRKEITGVTPGTGYFVGVSYRVRGVLGARRVLGPESVGELISGDARREISNEGRRIIRSLDDLGTTVTRLSLEANRTRAVFRDAGIIVDPAAGTAKIYAIEALGERVSAAEIKVAAVDGLAEVVASAVTSIAGKADASAVTALTGRVTAAEGAITAQAGDITTINSTLAGKASTTALSALDTRVTAAEGAITTQGSAITSLTSDVAGKASASAVSALDTRVTTAEGAISSQASALIAVTSDVGDAAATASLALSTANGEEAVAALTADVDGYVISMTLNGSEGSIKFRADYFEVRSVAGELLLGLSAGSYIFGGDVAGSVAGVPAEEIAAIATAGGVTTQPITALGASTEILVILDPGVSRAADAEFGYTGMSGASTVELKLQRSVDGGSWTDFGTPDSALGGVGEPVGVATSGTYTNSSGVRQAVRFRAFVSSSGGAVGTVTATSFVRA